MESFRVQLLGNLADGLPAGTQLRSAVEQRLQVAEVLIPSHGTSDLMLALITACPLDRHSRDLTVGTDVNGHSFHQAAHDLLARRDRGSGRVP